MNQRVQLCVAIALAAFSLSYCAAQERQGAPGGRFADLQRAMGTINSITSDKLVLQDAEGKTTTVKITPDTQFRKDRQPAKIDDFKAGDRVMVAGKPDAGGTLVAAFVASGQMMRSGMRPGMNGDRPSGPPLAADMARMGLGTRFIAGGVKKIDETKLTILRPDGQSQVIEVDENTSFRNDKNESVTLADVKVGDNVAGRGELKNGTFVPLVLRVGVQLPPWPAPETK